MNGVVSGEMRRAIVRARRTLRGATTASMLDYGLNRYRLAQNQSPIIIVVKDKKKRSRVAHKAPQPA